MQDRDVMIDLSWICPQYEPSFWMRGTRRAKAATNTIYHLSCLKRTMAVEWLSWNDLPESTNIADDTLDNKSKLF